MHYAIICYGDENVVHAVSKQEDEALMARIQVAHTKFAPRAKLGPRLRLMPTTAAVTVKAGDDPLVLDGPFAETKEQLLGMWIVEAAELDGAIEAAKHLMEARGSGSLEVRPISYFKDGEGAA